MKKNIFIVIFLIDIIFISIIPNLSKVFTSSGSILDYLIPYCASFICFLTIGILVGVLCIKKISQK
ncbi:hypothetical protein [Clostridium sp. JNZ J1-5]